MIEIKRQPPEPPRYSDPEELLAGKCMSCGIVVECLRRDAAKGSGGLFAGARLEPGVWSDMLSAGCPNCGARVFVMLAKEFRKVLTLGS